MPGWQPRRSQPVGTKHWIEHAYGRRVDGTADYCDGVFKWPTLDPARASDAAACAHADAPLPPSCFSSRSHDQLNHGQA